MQCSRYSAKFYLINYVKKFNYNIVANNSTITEEMIEDEDQVLIRNIFLLLFKIFIKLLMHVLVKRMRNFLVNQYFIETFFYT